MAVGQPTRQTYQRLAHSHQTRPGEVYLNAPVAAIPTGNPPIFVPRQDDPPPSSVPDSDVSAAPPPPSETPNTSQPPPPPTSESPSTSTPEPTSTQPPSTTSQPPTTTLPSTTTRESSSSNPSISSLEPSTTPTPSETPTSLGSSSLTFSPETTITSPVVLTINGQRTTSYVIIPTTLSDTTNVLTSSERTAIIAGSVAGGVTLILLVLAIILFYRRHQSKKKGFFPTSEPKPRTMLLSGEDLDDEYAYSRQSSNAPTPIPSSIRRVESPVNNLPRGTGVDPGPRLLRARASDTGSIFREEGIWPPPNDRLVDPILAGSHINLSNIVTEVMGSTAGQQNNGSGSNSVFRPRGGNRSTSGETSPVYSEGSVYSSDLPAVASNHRQGHGRGMSTNSEAPLIPPEPLYLASMRDSGSSPSILAPSYESGFDTSGSSTRISSNGARNWLDRSPRKIPDSPSNPFNRNPSPLVPDNGRYN